MLPLQPTTTGTATVSMCNDNMWGKRESYWRRTRWAPAPSPPSRTSLEWSDTEAPPSLLLPFSSCRRAGHVGPTSALWLDELWAVLSSDSDCPVEGAGGRSWFPHLIILFFILISNMSKNYFKFKDWVSEIVQVETRRTKANINKLKAKGP